MQCKSLIILGATLVSACSFPAFAQTFTREQAVEYALANNPGLRAAHEQSLAAVDRIQAAGSGKMPRITARYSTRRSNNPLDAFADKLNTRSVTSEDFNPALLNNPDPTTLNNAELALQVPLYTGGRLDAQMRQAEEMGVATRLQYERTRQEVAAQAVQAYLGVQAAHRAVFIAEDAVAAAQEHANTTARLQREGRIVASDNLTAEVNLTAVKGQREQARARLRQAQNQLALVMGMPFDTDLEVEAWTPSEKSEPARLGELETHALSRRKDLLAAGAQVNAGRALVDAARAEGNTRVDFLASTNWYDRSVGIDNSSWSVMGAVSKPLYNGGGTRYRSRAASHEASAMQAQMYSLEQSIRNDVRTAYINLQEAEARLALAGDNVERAQRSVGLIKKRYGEGRTILIDLLQAERALVEARNEELNSSFNLAESRVALQLATGELVEQGGARK